MGREAPTYHQTIRLLSIAKRLVSQRRSAATELSEKVQYGALPYRLEADGSIHFLLVTSRQTRRWVVPKGWPMAGKKPHQAAAREAFEEAGVVGSVGKRAVGGFRYWKRLQTTFALCRVDVYPLAVERLDERWPERSERTREWFDRETAAGLVDEPGLASLIKSFDPAHTSG